MTIIDARENDELQYIVNNLSPATYYQFNLTSVNDYGRRPSANSIVISTADDSKFNLGV